MAKLFIYLLFVALSVALCVGREDRCNQPIEGGLCYGNEDLFAYDSGLGKCRGFVYGGCGGNDNSFPTLKHCQNACEN